MACQYQDIPEDIKPPLNTGSDNNPSHSGILADIKEEMVDNGSSTDIKVELGTFASDTKTFQPAVIKTEDDEFSDLDVKYNKEEQYMALQEGTGCSRNGEDKTVQYDVARSGSSYELTSEVDLCVMKMEEDEDTADESTGDKERGEQHSAHNIHRFQHVKTHGEELKETFECIRCKKEFSTKHGLDGHIVALHGNIFEMMNSVTNNIHRCKHCRYMTVKKKHLIRHMGTHREKLEKSFNCIKCEKKFANKRCLDGHIVAHHSNNDDAELMKGITYKIYRCKHCSYNTVHTNSLTVHMRTHGEELDEIFHCMECEKKFSSKKRLDSHIVTRHSNNDEMLNSVACKIHRCKHCSYITAKTSRFTQHMRTHGVKFEKAYDCIKCEKEFSSKYSLDSHVVTRHSDDGEMMKNVTYKIHRCKHCSFITVQSDYLNNHLRMHGEKLEKTFDCMTCEKEFSSKRGLDNHIVTQHSGNSEMMKGVTCKIHCCKYCKYTTVYTGSLTKHTKTHGEHS